MAENLGEAVLRLSVDESGLVRGLNKSEQYFRDSAGRLRAANGRFVKDQQAAFGKLGGNMSQATGRVAQLGQRLRGVAVASTFGIGYAVKKFAEFDATMRQVGAVTDASAESMKALSALAKKMGAETSFSAKDAADAMLSLAKGGMTQAQIQGGALQSTLTLAAAGGIELGNAAMYMSNAMNAFGLEAKNSNAIAAALAGAANYSTASIESLGMGLAQTSAQARNTGLSLNETVGVLALFDQAGVKGSDAGTSLKVMLQSLTPKTKTASKAMSDLGLQFTDAHGNFKDITNIAEQLKQKFGGMSEAQRNAALETIFGSDASRAASILMRAGSKDLSKYIAATNDMGAAQKLAKTNTEGLSGAFERAKGSVETAGISLGEVLAPYVEKVLGFVEKLANKFTQLSPNVQLFIGVAVGLVAVLVPLIVVAGAVAAAIGSIAAVFAGVTLAGVAIVAGIALLAAAFVALMVKSESFRNGVISAFDSIKAGVMRVVGELQKTLQVWGSWARSFWRSHGTQVKSIVMPIFNTIKSIVSGALRFIENIVVTVLRLLRGDWKGAMNSLWTATKSAFSMLKGLFITLPAMLGGLIAKAGSAVLKAALNIGADIIRGIWNGIKAGAGKIVSAVTDLASSAITALKKKLHIASPSRVMAKEIGIPIAQGVAVGINRGAESATKAAEKLGERIQRALASKLRPTDLALAFVEYKKAVTNFAGGDIKKVLKEQLRLTMKRIATLTSFLKKNAKKLTADTKLNILQELTSLYQGAADLKEQINPKPDNVTESTTGLITDTKKSPLKQAPLGSGIADRTNTRGDQVANTSANTNNTVVMNFRGDPDPWSASRQAAFAIRSAGLVGA